MSVPSRKTRMDPAIPVFVVVFCIQIATIVLSGGWHELIHIAIMTAILFILTAVILAVCVFFVIWRSRNYKHPLAL